MGGIAMQIILSADVRIDERKCLELVRSDRFWKYAAYEWHRLYKDYVPMQSGALYNNVTIAPKTITHHVPYAHYMYMGQVYGPNMPIYEGDNLAGFFSQPNRRKKPTGKSLNFSKQLHPKASAKWDKAAEPTQKSKLIQSLQSYVDSGGHSGAAGLLRLGRT